MNLELALRPDCDAPAREAQNPHAALACRYVEALLRLDRDGAQRHVEAALADGIPVRSIYLDVLAASQWEIGRRWERHEISVAQEHYCTAASQVIMARLGAALPATAATAPLLVAACARGNLHEFGLRLLADLFAMAGWRTVYLGAGVPDADLVALASDARADVIALSASLEAHVPRVANTVRALRDHPRARRAMILVGGDAFNATPGLWREVGADGHAADAGEAVAVATRMMREDA